MGEARRWTLVGPLRVEGPVPGFGESVEVVAVEDARAVLDELLVAIDLGAAPDGWAMACPAACEATVREIASRLGLDDDTSTTKGEQGGD